VFRSLLFSILTLSLVSTSTVSQASVLDRWAESCKWSLLNLLWKDSMLRLGNPFSEREEKTVQVAARQIFEGADFAEAVQLTKPHRHQVPQSIPGRSVLEVSVELFGPEGTVQGDPLDGARTTPTGTLLFMAGESLRGNPPLHGSPHAAERLHALFIFGEE
jgi:hypothetical protein